MLDTEFRYYLADTDAGKSLHYRLRYDVYCVREGYENQKHYPDKQEKDQFDNTSAHFLVQSCATGDWVGAMRLVLGTAPQLPMTQITPIDQEFVAGLDGEIVAEASRLCAVMPKPTQSRTSSSGWPRHAMTKASRLIDQRLHVSWIAVGLIRAARHYCLDHGIETCFFLINEPLARILRRLGMEIEPVGSPCHHRGWRRPYCHNFITGYREMADHSPELYKSFCRPNNAYNYYSELEQIHEPMIMAISA